MHFKAVLFFSLVLLDPNATIQNQEEKHRGAWDPTKHMN